MAATGTEVLLRRLRRPRAPLVAASAAVLVAALGLGLLLLPPGLRSAGPASRSADTASPGSPGPPRSPAAVLPPAGTEPAQTAPALARALAAQVRNPAFAGQLAGVVLDGTGRALFARRADTLAPPASTAKLATAVAALAVLGGQTRLRTVVMRSGARVVLVGGGDPLLASPKSAAADPTLASLDTLAARTAAGLRRSGLTRVALGYDTSRYSGPGTAPGWKPDYLTGDVARVSPLMVDEGRTSPTGKARGGDPTAAAVRAFAARLAAHGVRLSGAPKPAAGSGAVLAAVEGPAVATLVARMLSVSDNSLAEALAREVAGRSGLPRSFAGAAAAVRRAVAAVGVDPAALRLVDGSGLSTLDRATPRALAGLLVAASGRADLRPLFPGLPVAGFTGTLAERYRHGPAIAAAGLVRAKTGTLRGVSALAGVAVDPHGALTTFAFLAPRVSDQVKAEAALDRVATAVATCACR